MDKATQITLGLLRVVAGLLFYQPGAMKLFGFFGGMPSGSVMTTEIWIAGVLEVLGGILLMLGLGTRVVAFILSGEMAVAYWQVHAKMGTWPVQNHGEPAVLLCFICLFLSANGAGTWSLDALIRSKRTASSRVRQ